MSVLRIGGHDTKTTTLATTQIMLLHQPPDALAVHSQHAGELAAAEKGRPQILLVDPTHQREGLGRFARRPVVPRASRESQQCALPRDRQPLVFRFDASSQSFR